MLKNNKIGLDAFIFGGIWFHSSIMNTTNRIHLISGPRNVSTALMYSFAQRSDTTVLDEPFYASYLHESGVEHPGRDEVLKAQSTDVNQVIRHKILGEYSTSVLFIKNMAHHMEHINWDFLQHTQNVFLIRNPREMLTSFIKTIPEPTLKDTAYRQQYELFGAVQNINSRTPVVIDSRELLLDPPGVLKKLCQRLNISFEPGMLQWRPGPISEDGVWAEHWYHNVHRSTGFKPYRPKNESVPPEFSTLLEQCQYYYNELENFSIKADKHDASNHTGSEK